MSQTIVRSLVTTVPWLLLVLGLIIAVWLDPYTNRRNRRLILLINVLVLLLMAAEMTEYSILLSEPRDLLRTCASAFGYAVRPVLLVLFLRILYPDRHQKLLWAAAGVNAAVYFVSIFTGIAFYIQENGFHRGPLNFLCLILSALLILDLTVQLIRTSRQNDGKETMIPIFAAGTISLGTLMDGLTEQLSPINYLTKAIIISIIFYYIRLQMQLSRQHEEESLANLQAEHRIQLMVSQIQPHFLFNTLSTIQALCRIDPEKAFHLVERFGQYLRQNLDSLNQTALIPFEKEMEHTKIYVEIEQVRFPSIRIRYDLLDVHFSLPVLTVQPLVENAIRHGVRICENGEITVLSRQEEGRHVVIIRDNGKGFDADAALQADGKHIGLRNVRERVEQMCAGSMEIDSRIGEGTTVTLRFPAGEEQA